MGNITEAGGEPINQPIIQWCAAHRPMLGEIESGDHYIVRILADCTYVAVIDGLGHGPEAAKAARQAAHILEACTDQDIASLTRRCHEALLSTRGAVIGFALFMAGTGAMQWLGVGNIAGVVLHARSSAGPSTKTLVSRGGTVGYRLPSLAVSTVPIGRDDLVILATDGIRSNFADRLRAGTPMRKIADQIMSEFGKQSDDALVLVTRYLGSAQ
jgi:phosphoserine phosphatase RsbX